jgi:hypothetical protein
MGVTDEERFLVEQVEALGFHVPRCADCDDPIRGFAKGSRRGLCDECRGKRFGPLHRPEQQS